MCRHGERIVVCSLTCPVFMGLPECMCCVATELCLNQVHEDAQMGVAAKVVLVLSKCSLINSVVGVASFAPLLYMQHRLNSASWH